jgi:hypothetical protein
MNLDEKNILNELIEDLSDKGKVKKNELSLNNEKKICSKTCCKGAFKYNTFIKAYDDIKENNHVYFVKIDDNYRLYRECKKNSIDGSGLCHIHKRMKESNPSELKFFETDILPKSANDKDRYLASIDDPFFGKIEKRNNKEKQKEQLKFKKNNPINLVLTSGNEALKTQLTLFATQLLNNNTLLKEENKKIKSASEEISEQISSLKSVILEKDVDVIEEDDDADEDDEENNDDVEEVSVIEIETEKGRKLYLSPENNYIIDPQDEETVLGIMAEINPKYSTIIYESKSYTVLKDRNHDEKGKIHICVLSNNVFDVSFNYIGKYKKNKAGIVEYTFKK